MNEIIRRAVRCLLVAEIAWQIVMLAGDVAAGVAGPFPAYLFAWNGLNIAGTYWADRRWRHHLRARPPLTMSDDVGTVSN